MMTSFSFTWRGNKVMSPMDSKALLVALYVVAIAHAHHVAQHLVLFLGVVAALAALTTSILLLVEVLVANSDLLHS